MEDQKKTYRFGFSENTIDKISEDELKMGLDKYQDGFAVRGTLDQFKKVERQLGIENYRGLLFERGIDFAEDGMPLLQSRIKEYKPGESLLLVHVSTEHNYILFVLLLKKEERFEQDFGLRCRAAVEFADKHVRHSGSSRSIITHTGLLFGEAFTHVVGKISSLQ